MTVVSGQPTVTVEQRRAQRVSAVAAGAPGLALRVLAVVYGVFLAYDFPTVWFQPPSQGSGNVSSAVESDGLIGPALVLLAGLAAMSVLGNLVGLYRIAAIEPIIPAIIGLAFLSTFWSEVPQETFTQAVALAVTAFYGYWLVAIFRPLEILTVLAAVMAIGTFLHLGFALAIPQYGQAPAGSWVGVMLHENPLGRITALAILVFLLVYACFPTMRIVALAFIGLNLVVLWFSTSKTALVTVGAMAGCLVVFRMFRARKTLYGAVAVSIAGTAVFLMAFVTANLDFVTDALDKDVTLSGRTILWDLSIRAALERPLTGYGWFGFWTGSFGPSHDVLDFNPGWTPPHSHNGFLELFLAFGVTGLLLGLALYLRLFVRGARVVGTFRTPLGLFPLTFTTFAFFFSLTEFGAISRSIFFSLLVIVASLAGLYGRDVVDESEPPSSETTRVV